MARPERSLRLTDDSVKKVAAPASGRLYLRDSEVRGFILDVTANGVKTFRLYKKIDGRPRRILIAQFDGRNTKDAREACKVLVGKLAAGDDLDKPDQAGGPTVAVFFDRWLQDYAKHHRPGTWRHDLQLFDSHIRATLGRRPIRSVRPAHVRALHAKIAEAAAERSGGPGPAPKGSTGAGHRTANRMLQLLSILFNVAREWGVTTAENPTIGVRRFKEARRERYLQPDEAARFFATLADRGTVENPGTTQDACDFIMLGLFTGARRSNLMAMRWADLSLDGALWTIPGDVTKTGRAYHVPLVPPAVAVLAARHQNAVPGYPWVFPANSASGHLVSFQKQWDHFRKRAGLPDLRFHDLRHTLASWQAIGGTSLAIIGKGLGHSSPNTTSRYAHINVDPVRASMDRAATAMLEAAGLIGGSTPARKPKQKAIGGTR